MCLSAMRTFRFLDGVDTEIEADEDIRIIPSIAGGR